MERVWFSVHDPQVVGAKGRKGFNVRRLHEEVGSVESTCLRGGGVATHGFVFSLTLLVYMSGRVRPDGVSKRGSFPTATYTLQKYEWYRSVRGYGSVGVRVLYKTAISYWKPHALCLFPGAVNYIKLNAKHGTAVRCVLYASLFVSAVQPQTLGFRLAFRFALCTLHSLLVLPLSLEFRQARLAHHRIRTQQGGWLG